MLKKLCNHPDLLNLPRELSGSERCFPEGYSIKEKVRHVRPEFSGKMTILARFASETYIPSENEFRFTGRSNKAIR